MPKPFPTAASFSGAGADPAAPAKGGALGALSLSMALSSLGGSIVSVALPALSGAFSATLHEVQWVVLAYLLAVTIAIVGVGRLGDLAGRRRLLLAGIALFTLASALCAAAPALWMLIAARGLQGLGAAIMMALSLALVRDLVPEAKAGSAMGRLGAFSAAGTAVGPVVGGLAIAGPGWQAMFLVAVPAGIASFVLALRHLPADRSAKLRGRRFDVTGMAVLALTLGSYALALSAGRGAGLGGVDAMLLLVAAIGAAVFFLVEARSPSPLVPVSLLRDPALCAGLAMNMIAMTAMMATLVIGPFYLVEGLGMGAGGAGLAMSAGPLVAALGGAPAGRMVDRLGSAPVAAAGLGAMAVACVALAFLPAALGIAGYVAPLALLTAGYALFQAANTTAVMLGSGSDRRGVVAAMLQLARNLGLVTGASAMTAVFAAALGTGDTSLASAQAVAHGTRVSFLFAASLTVLAFVPATLGSHLQRTGQKKGRSRRTDP